MYTSLVSLWTVHTQHKSSAIYIHCISLQYTWVHIQRFGSQLFAHTLHIFWSYYSFFFYTVNKVCKIICIFKSSHGYKVSVRVTSRGRCSPSGTLYQPIAGLVRRRTAREPCRFETTWTGSARGSCCGRRGCWCFSTLSRGFTTRRADGAGWEG